MKNQKAEGGARSPETNLCDAPAQTIEFAFSNAVHSILFTVAQPVLALEAQSAGVIAGEPPFYEFSWLDFPWPKLEVGISNGGVPLPIASIFLQAHARITDHCHFYSSQISNLPLTTNITSFHLPRSAHLFYEFFHPSQNRKQESKVRPSSAYTIPSPFQTSYTLSFSPVFVLARHRVFLRNLVYMPRCQLGRIVSLFLADFD